MIEDFMNKRGFVFVETIVTLTILIAALVIIYSAYSSAFISEKDKLYIDDIVSIYETNHVLERLKEDNDFSAELNEHYIIQLTGNHFTDASVLADQYYHMESLFYIPDVKALKDCLNGNDGSQKCSKSKSLLDYPFIKKYNLEDYIKKLYIKCESNETDECHDYYNGIVISLIKENKNGELINNSYTKCIKQKAYEYYLSKNSNYCGSLDIDSCKDKAATDYGADSTINYSNECETVYYVSWVYYNA